jgi:hypothetical protein
MLQRPISGYAKVAPEQWGISSRPRRGGGGKQRRYGWTDRLRRHLDVPVLQLQRLCKRSRGRQARTMDANEVRWRRCGSRRRGMRVGECGQETACAKASGRALVKYLLRKEGTQERERRRW